MTRTEMLLTRRWRGATSTMGELTINGAYECYTLEDPIREHKIHGSTAIPAGLYAVVLSLSKRFGRVMPEILGVPGFSGVRIHAGNRATDTEGCILVGLTHDADSIGQSVAAYARLMAKLKASDLITIQIVNEVSP